VFNIINILVVLAFLGDLELQDKWAAQRNQAHHYLTHPDLPNPQEDTALATLVCGSE